MVMDGFDLMPLPPPRRHPQHHGASGRGWDVGSRGGWGVEQRNLKGGLR
jgi:hypothetical protein